MGVGGGVGTGVGAGVGKERPVSYLKAMLEELFAERIFGYVEKKKMSNYP